VLRRDRGKPIATNKRGDILGGTFQSAKVTCPQMVFKPLITGIYAFNNSQMPKLALIQEGIKPKPSKGEGFYLEVTPRVVHIGD